MDFTLIAVIVVALAFDFTNGFHDTANAIATMVSTRAISPKLAVIGAALLNFAGAFVSIKVAATVAKGIVDPHAITLHIVLAGLLGAIIWNLVTWRMALPTSSSHALIGGVAGAAIVGAGLHVVEWQGLVDKVLIPSLVAPFLGLVVAGLLMLLILRITRHRSETKVSRVFKKLQLVSGGFVAFTHGTNDAQKTMGIIALALIAANPGEAFSVPLWVVVSSATAMAAGTYLGGWRIIDTLGQKITKLKPEQGFAAETSTASMLFATAHMGFPVSTTHTISGSIVGAGAATDPSSVRWKVIKHIGIAWLITLPCAALIGGGVEALTRLSGNSGMPLAISVVLIAAIYISRDWTWESTTQIKNHLNFMRRSRKVPVD